MPGHRAAALRLPRRCHPKQQILSPGKHRVRELREVLVATSNVKQREGPRRKRLKVSCARNKSRHCTPRDYQPDPSLHSLTKPIEDLTVVEEVDTELAIEDATKAQSQPSIEVAVPRRSLGGVSAISGTTAISSFTFVEPEALNARFILRHLSKLHGESVEFLNHLVPEESKLADLQRHIEEVKVSDSDFVADYNDFDNQLSTRLVHYRGESQRYIHVRAVHNALFGANRDSAAAQTGLDLLLYQANLIVFAKDMIITDRDDKDMATTLRDQVNYFPAPFLSELISNANIATSVTGDSALWVDTSELALEMRTQLAILSLQRGATDQAFEPIAALDEVFYNSNVMGADQFGAVRGWNTLALGGEDIPLSEEFAQKVEKRVALIRTFFRVDEESEDRVRVDLDDLKNYFPWDGLVMRLLDWVRLRSQELQATIQQQGGASGICDRVKAEKDNPAPVAKRDPPVQRTSPRKNRTSFGSNRRRSSKFNPNAEVDDQVFNKLLAIEGRASTHAQDASRQETHVEDVGAEPETEPIVQEHDDEDEYYPDAAVWPTEQDREPSQPTQALDSLRSTQVLESTRPPREPETSESAPILKPSRLTQVPTSSQPPQSTNDFVKLLKETHTANKENRATSIFDRQANAVRVEFGDGFDDEPTPGPSTRQPSRKGKEPQRSNPNKRKIVESSDDDDDSFDTVQRSANVERQRAKAPKRVRMNPASSRAPPSHQPRHREDDDAEYRHIDEFEQAEYEEPSEAEAPDMTEEIPPRSTYQDQVALARSYTSTTATRKERRPRRPWSDAEENAFIEYMGDYPRQYARILKLDKAGDAVFYDRENGELTARRTDVDLKDKARVMARNMVK